MNMSKPTPHDYETVEEIASEFMHAIDTNASDYGKAAQILRDYVDAENAKLRTAALDVVGDMTPNQLAYHEAYPPYEGSRPDLARLYRAAKLE